MMMRALYEGLTEGQLLYQPGQDQFTDEEINPDGLYEVGQAYYMQAHFMRRVPENTLIKILFDGLPSLPVREGYRIVFMLRDPEEIQASVEKVDQRLKQSGVVENPKSWYPFDVFRPYLQEDIDHVLGICKARADIEITTVRYSQVVENPLATFVGLQALGFPIDPVLSAKCVKPELYREKGCQQHEPG